jgi:hypothetical protein
MTKTGVFGALSRAIPLFLVLGLVVAVQAQLAPARAAGTTYNITRTDDPNTVACATPASGCSLRQALVAIAAAPAGGPYLVKLPAGNYANDLAAQFPITGDVSIVGAGSATTTVNGSATSRVFYLTGTGAAVSISDLKITGGNSAGAGGEGGGVGMAGTNNLTLTRVAVVGNTAVSGGGIDAQATIGSGTKFKITDSLVSGNTASAIGGGGILFKNQSSPAALTNTTITGNSAIGDGGGLFLNNSFGPLGTISISSSTITGNSASMTGGNLYGSAYTIRNSIISGGTSATPTTMNCSYGGAGGISAGYNIEGTSECLPVLSTGDQVSTDPKVGPLPASPNAATTLPLLQNSPAINAGNPAGCKDAGGAPVAHDQRGFARPQGSACDVGAYEFRAPSFTGVPTITGTTAVGKTLTCTLHLGAADGATGAGLTWLRGTTPVSTASAYKIVAADAGRPLRCRADASNPAGTKSSLSVVRNVPPQCVVPALKGKTLTKARAALRKAHCRLGTVKKPHTHAKLVVSKQSPKPGVKRVYGTKVNVTLKKK